MLPEAVGGGGGGGGGDDEDGTMLIMVGLAKVMTDVVTVAVVVLVGVGIPAL